MRKVVLFSAVSLDHYIARTDGAVDWLFTDGDYGYQAFYDSIDTTLMGNATYQQVLSFGPFPYAEKTNFVFTKNSNASSDANVTFITEAIPAFVKDLKEQKGKDIWLVGGGSINVLLLTHGLIDTLVLSVHPIWLGQGIPLFPAWDKTLPLELLNSKSYSSGLVQLTYAIKKYTP